MAAHNSLHMSAGAHRIVGFNGTGVTGKIVRHLILLGTELFPVPSFLFLWKERILDNQGWLLKGS